MIFHWAADKEHAFCPGNPFPAFLIADTHGSQRRDAGLDDRCKDIDLRDQGNPVNLRVPIWVGLQARLNDRNIVISRNSKQAPQNLFSFSSQLFLMKYLFHSLNCFTNVFAT